MRLIAIPLAYRELPSTLDLACGPIHADSTAVDTSRCTHGRESQHLL